MKAVIQRVKHASVSVGGKLISKINYGVLIYLGIKENDTLDDAIKYSNKISKLRIFEDDAGKMNNDLKSINGEILVVSQFTLYGDLKRGNRPSFTNAAKPEDAIMIYNAFIDNLATNFTVKTGIFGANMDIESINDGPVTIILENL